MQVLLLARHGQSLQNVAQTVNGDPALDRGLSKLGVEQATDLARQLIGITIDLCATSEFLRSQQTARLALADRAETTATIVDHDLNDVRVGDLEGEKIDAYRAWKHAHTRATAFPGGESLDGAARRYAAAFQRLLDRPERTLLCVCHEIPVRYAVNAALGSDELDGPLHDVANATPYLFDPDGLRRAITRLRELAP
jgi:probable phosphoglycerate mutase